MKRSAKQESKCRRMEFKCRLYDIIKDLERSLEPEPNRQGQFQGELGEQQGMKTMANKAKNPEFCCPPGCCKESLKLQLPKMASTNRENVHPKTTPITSATVSEQTTREDAMGHLPWHEDDHGNGCWPGHGERSSGGAGGVCYYCCDTNPAKAQVSNALTPRLPNTTEEIQQMGCFFARAA